MTITTTTRRTGPLGSATTIAAAERRSAELEAAADALLAAADAAEAASPAKVAKRPTARLVSGAFGTAYDADGMLPDAPAFPTTPLVGGRRTIRSGDTTADGRYLARLTREANDPDAALPTRRTAAAMAHAYAARLSGSDRSALEATRSLMAPAYAEIGYGGEVAPPERTEIDFACFATVKLGPSNPFERVTVTIPRSLGVLSVAIRVGADAPVHAVRVRLDAARRLASMAHPLLHAIDLATLPRWVDARGREHVNIIDGDTVRLVETLAKRPQRVRIGGRWVTTDAYADRDRPTVEGLRQAAAAARSKRAAAADRTRRATADGTFGVARLSDARTTVRRILAPLGVDLPAAPAVGAKPSAADDTAMAAAIVANVGRVNARAAAALTRAAAAFAARQAAADAIAAR